MATKHRFAGFSLVLAACLAACGGTGAAPTASGPVGTTSASSPASLSNPGATGATDPSAPALAKVNANTASVDQLQAAFEAVGISNADRWAREVAEYRPYAADPTWAQLRQELGKYNIDPAVLEQIISLLEV